MTITPSKLLTFEEFIDWLPQNSIKRYELHDGIIVEVTTLTANRKRSSESISNLQMRLAVSRADQCLSLHSQESVVQPTHVLKDLTRCSGPGQ